MAGAAFFDLDRTLLRGASGPLITEALTKVGLVTDRNIPGQDALYRVFNAVGETLPAMALARGAALAAKGWSLDTMRQAGKVAAEQLEELVAPYAKPLIAEHRAAGRPLVLATTTPYELIRPLADLLGFDDVVATRYAHAEGVLTGALEGGFVWSRGKLDAVRQWAADNGIDLGESYAYSDSIYDAPLLSAVGFPHAVNPDPRLQLFATVRRWPVMHFDVPAGIPKVAGIEPSDILKLGARPEFFPYAAVRHRGHRADPAARSGDCRGEPPLVLRHGGAWAHGVEGGTLAPLSRQEGSIRRADHRTARNRPGRHPRRTREWLGRTAQASGRSVGRWRHRRADATRHDPARRGVLRSGVEGPPRRGPPRGDVGCAGDPRRVVGNREGVAAQPSASRGCGTSCVRRTSPSASARPSS